MAGWGAGPVTTSANLGKRAQETVERGYKSQVMPGNPAPLQLFKPERLLLYFKFSCCLYAILHNDSQPFSRFGIVVSDSKSRAHCSACDFGRPALVRTLVIASHQCTTRLWKDPL